MITKVLENKREAPNKASFEKEKKKSNLFADTISKIELPMEIHENLHLKTPSSKNNDEKSKTSVDIEVPTREEIDIPVESALPLSQMFPTDYSLSSQLYIAQRGNKLFSFKCSN